MKKTVFQKVALCLAIIFTLSFTLTGCNWPWKDKDSSLSGEPTYWTIQYTDDDGTHQLKVEEGMPFSIEKIPHREGYDFLGLFDAEVGGTQYVAANGSSLSVFTDKRNMVLFPQYRVKRFTLQLNYGNAPDAGIETVEVSYNGEIRGLPDDFSMEGRKFIGWYNTQDTTGTKFTNGMVMSKTLANLADESNHIALYAVFETAQYTVRFYSYDGNTLIDEQQVAHGTNISEVAPKTLSDGTEILSWCEWPKGENFTGFTGEITESKNYYVRSYSCILNIDSADGSETQTKKVESRTSYKLEALSRKGYNFLGWEDGKGKLWNAGETIKPTENMTLTAKWEAISYTVTFSVKEEEGTVTSDSQTVTFDSDYNFPIPVSLRGDYQFDGWYYNGRKLTDQKGNSLSKWDISDNTAVTVTADFKRIEYTITFDSNGGSQVETKTVYKGDSFSLPTPTKAGCNFNYWKTSSGTEVTSPYRPTGDITLYADWTANNYTIVLDPQGGRCSLLSKEVTYDASYELPVPQRSGYTFNGWYTSVSSNGTKLTDDGGKSTQKYNWSYNITAYAVWVSDITASLSRVGCQDDQNYNPNSNNGKWNKDRDAKTHAAFELVQAILGGVAVTSDDTYFVPQGSSLSLSLQVLQDLGDLPKSGSLGANWFVNALSTDSCTSVYGTGISGKVGKGAYSVVITYGDGTKSEITATNFMDGMSKNGTKSIPLNLNFAKQVASIKITVVYEIYYRWWNGGFPEAYSNWRCEKTFDFA